VVNHYNSVLQLRLEDREKADLVEYLKGCKKRFSSVGAQSLVIPAVNQTCVAARLVDDRAAG
jgi:hypothetical protein